MLRCENNLIYNYRPLTILGWWCWARHSWGTWWTWDPRLTLTLPALCAARSVLFLVSGAEKAATVAEVLAGRRPELPAARVRPEGELHWLLDRAAASRIR